MNIPTPKRLQQFPEYVFSRTGKLIKEVEKKSGRKVLNLGIGSPDFPPSKVYLEKYKEYIDAEKAHKYPGYGANPQFSKALTDWYKTRFNVALDKDELLPLLGAKDGTSHIPLALLDAHDEILVPDPGYPGFSGPVLLFGAKPVYYNLGNAENPINIETVQKKTSQGTKAIWINFPSNPTGIVANIQQLKPLVEFAQNNNVIILYDNAYSEITYDGFVAPSILEIEGAKDVAVELGSFSKTFSFAGDRMGWIVGNKTIIANLAKIKSQLDSGLATPLQNLGAYALSHPDKDWSQKMLASYQNRRDILVEKFSKLGLEMLIPKGGLYLWAKIPQEEIDSESYMEKLLKEKQVFVAPGTAFGENGMRFVRISFCSDIDNISNYL